MHQEHMPVETAGTQFLDADSDNREGNEKKT